MENVTKKYNQYFSTECLSFCKESNTFNLKLFCGGNFILRDLVIHSSLTAGPIDLGFGTQTTKKNLRTLLSKIPS
jgi:hypothetical protein